MNSKQQIGGFFFEWLARLLIKEEMYISTQIQQQKCAISPPTKTPTIMNLFFLYDDNSW